MSAGIATTTIRPWRAALIGCGWIGSRVADDPRAQGIQAHAAAYDACADTELVAVCDPDPGSVRDAAQRWSVAGCYADHQELLEQVQPEIVSVCTPDETHAAVIQAALECASVKAIVAEKPIAMDLEEARELVRFARERGVVLAMNYLRRLAPSHVEARERIAAGALGRIQVVHGFYTKGVTHNGTHWFDLVRWLVGNVTAVQAWPSAASPHGSDPTCHVRLQFAGGQTGQLQALDGESYTVFEMDVCGTKGRLRIEDSGMRLRWSNITASPHYSGYSTLHEAALQAGSYENVALYLVQDVVGALRDRREPRCTGKDALAALAIAHAARSSLALNREVVVEDIE